MKNTLYVPDLRSNLLSVARIADNGYEVQFHKDRACINSSNGNTVMTAERVGNLYVFKRLDEQAYFIADPIDIVEWHSRIGHLNGKDLLKLLNHCGYNTKEADLRKISNCDVCAKGKMSSLPFSRSGGPCNELLRIVHSDIVGPLKTQSIGGAKYFVTFIDDSTRWCEVYLLGKKSAVFSAFKLYKSHAERLTA